MIYCGDRKVKLLPEVGTAIHFRTDKELSSPVTLGVRNTLSNMLARLTLMDENKEMSVLPRVVSEYKDEFLED